MLAKLDEVRGAGRQALEILKAAGVKIGFGTDLLGEMHAQQLTEFAIRAEVLPAEEILCSATAANAELLQRADELGRIAPGALADLIVVEGNPLEDIGLLSGQGDGRPRGGIRRGYRYRPPPRPWRSRPAGSLRAACEDRCA